LTAPTINSGSSVALSLQSNGTTGIYMDTSQNVGIGTISPTQKLTVATAANSDIAIQLTNGLGSLKISDFSDGSTAFENTASYPMRYIINGSERMRIDSSGNLLVGTTSGAGQLVVYGSNATAGIFLTKTSGSSNGMVINSATSTTGQVAILNQNNGSTTSYWYNDGNLYLPGGTSGIHATSDERLKKDITYLTDKTVAGYKGLDVVLSLKPVTFRFKTEDESAPLHRGWIAQDFEQHMPELVAENPIPGSENITPYKAIADGGLIPVLVAAIQEQQALITDLQAKLKSAGVAGF